MRWGMVIDLRKCVGCQTCTIACKMEHGLPPSVAWRWVADIEVGTFPNVTRTFLPLGCQHCASPPCRDVCPTTATQKREDGVVTVDYEKCIGCGYCVLACPYRARTVIHDETWYFPGGPTAPEAAAAHTERVGVCTKCTFCLHRWDGTDGKRPGVDAETTPMCSLSCIANAIHFGDLDDPESNVSGLIRENTTTRLMEELGTDPSIYYIVAPAPFLPSASTEGEGTGEGGRSMRGAETSEVALPATPQAVWGDLAVVNFSCGGAGAGAVLGIFAASVLTPVSGRAIRLLEVIALLLVGTGFAAVGAEAGRPLRGFNVFRHLRRSWMSREALAAVGFGALTLLDAIVPGPWQLGLGAAAALAFMLSQGFILFAARGVPAWAVGPVPLLFVVSGLTQGLGLVLVVLAALGEMEALRTAAGLGAGAILLGVVAWWAYAGSPAGPAARQEALSRLRSGRVPMAVVGLGHTLPLAVLVAVLASGGPRPGLPGWMLTALAGICMAAGGAMLKWAVVRRAGLLHPLGLRIGRPSAARDIAHPRPPHAVTRLSGGGR